MPSITCPPVTLNPERHRIIARAVPADTTLEPVQDLDDRYHAADHSVLEALPSPLGQEKLITSTPPCDRTPSRDPADGAETRVADLESFRRSLRPLSSKYLRDGVDVYLEAWDEARGRGDHDAIVRAEAEWNAAWDEIDWHDAMAREAAS
jgi:hypothetical protein